MRGHIRDYAMAFFCAFMGAGASARALDITSIDNVQPSAWIVDLGGYGVLEPSYEGSKHYIMSFKPQVDVWQAGGREWLSFPHDAVSYSFYETNNFRTGPAAVLTLQSRYHGEDIDLRIGKADADLAGGGFAEYYPVNFIRTRVELLQGITSNLGFAANLSADYIWRPSADWTLTFGPRAQLANDQWASAFFSAQSAQRTGLYVPYHAEGGVISSGLEVTGKYDWTRELSAKFFIDYTQLVGDAADTPKVSVRGSSEQLVMGFGASYKFAVSP
jgi:MipA family protein